MVCRIFGRLFFMDTLKAQLDAKIEQIKKDLN